MIKIQSLGMILGVYITNSMRIKKSCATAANQTITEYPELKETQMDH